MPAVRRNRPIQHRLERQRHHVLVVWTGPNNKPLHHRLPGMEKAGGRRTRLRLLRETTRQRSRRCRRSRGVHDDTLPQPERRSATVVRKLRNLPDAGILKR